jgi:hypothetical protein
MAVIKSIIVLCFLVSMTIVVEGKLHVHNIC